MLQFAGNFVWVSRSLPRCIGRKLLKKGASRTIPGLVPGEFTVYKKGRSNATTHDFSQNLI